jgi:3',5'-cyclic AMP phosphodiesterase CpdA
LFSLVVGYTAAISAEDKATLPVLPGGAKPFSFVVLGDMHYKRPDFSSRKIASAIAASVRDNEPPVAFVCQTGDIAEGGTYDMKDGKRIFRLANHDETKSELDYALRDVTEAFQLPLFIAAGNHDKHGGGTAFPAAVWPMVSRQLNAPVTNNCYGFRHGPCAFVFLDFAPADHRAQQDQIRQLLKQAQAQGGLQHIFLFAHYPLWPLIRPGFSSAKLTDSLLPIFKEFPVDAFFCGHTHNTSAWVRQLDGATITQIQGVACQDSPELTPMEERRTFLLPMDALSYYWGYLSGPKNGFFLVTVDSTRVRVQFRAGAQLIREFAWQEPGQLTDVTKPAPRPTVALDAAALNTATSATLAFCPWADDRADLNIILNGERITTAQVGPTMRSNAFVDEQRIPIPADKLKLLRLANELTFENPGRAIFALGHAYLEVRLADGRTARTAIAARFFFSSSEADGRAAKKKYGWEIIPASALKGVTLGQPLGPMPLHFGP